MLLVYPSSYSELLPCVHIEFEERSYRIKDHTYNSCGSGSSNSCTLVLELHRPLYAAWGNCSSENHPHTPDPGSNPHMRFSCSYVMLPVPAMWRYYLTGVQWLVARLARQCIICNWARFARQLPTFYPEYLEMVISHFRVDKFGFHF